MAGLALVAAPLAGAAAEDAPLGAEMTGATELEEDAGWIEARLLTGIVAKEAARRIVDDTGIDFTSLAVVVLPLPKDDDDSASTIGGQGWDVIGSAEGLPKVQDLVQVRDGVAGFAARYRTIAAAAKAACKPEAPLYTWESDSKGFIGVLGQITNALNAATPILNLFKQDFLYQGLQTGVRDGMLVTAVRGEIVARREAAAAIAAPSGGSGPGNFSAAIDALAAQLAAPVAPDDCAEGEAHEQARAALMAEFEAFSAALAEPGSVEGSSVLDAANDQLARYGLRPATLVLAIEADGASLVKRSNLITMFGAESTTISSGIVVSYEFYEPGSAGIAALKAAGVLSCMSGAVGIRKLHKAGKLKDQAICY